MGTWTIIAAVVVTGWTCCLALGWLLCRAAQRADEEGPLAPVIELRPKRFPSAAQRR
jgi:hypothetical protein